MATQETLYDRMNMLYWVIMNLVTHVSFNIEAKKEEVADKKEGGEEIARDWKDHNEDCLLMQGKVNQIASGLGIFLYFLEMEQQLGGGSSPKANGQGTDSMGGLHPQHADDSVQAYGFPCHDPLPYL